MEWEDIMNGNTIWPVFPSVKGKEKNTESVLVKNKIIFLSYYKSLEFILILK